LFQQDHKKEHVFIHYYIKKNISEFSRIFVNLREIFVKSDIENYLKCTPAADIRIFSSIKKVGIEHTH